MANELTKKLSDFIRDLKTGVDEDLPLILGNRVVELTKQNFQTESFFGRKWRDVLRRTGGTRTRRGRNGKTYTCRIRPKSGAAGQRKILTGNTGNLGRSIEMTEGRGEVTIKSDVVYAAVHNDGLKAGRGRGFTMPRRQFLGDDDKLREELIRKVEKYVERLAKTNGLS